jgi:hypothetical protein
MSAIRLRSDRAHWQGIHAAHPLLQRHTTSGGRIFALTSPSCSCISDLQEKLKEEDIYSAAFRFQPCTTTGRKVLTPAKLSCIQLRNRCQGKSQTKEPLDEQSLKQPWWNKRKFRHRTSTVCHGLTEAEERSASARPRDRRPSWNVGGILDIYFLKSMLPAFGMSLALCAVLGMSLGALVELVREVISAGESRFSFGQAYEKLVPSHKRKTHSKEISCTFRK